MSELAIHHVGIVVSDLEEAVAFYRDTLGLSVADEFTLAEDGIGTAIGVEDVTGDFVHLEGNGARVELIEYDPTGSDSRADAINGLGAQHVGFVVEDIQEFYEQLPDDAEPLSSPQPVETGTSIVFFRDPDGNFLEVVEA